MGQAVKKEGPTARKQLCKKERGSRKTDFPLLAEELGPSIIHVVWVVIIALSLKEKR